MTMTIPGWCRQTFRSDPDQDSGRKPIKDSGLMPITFSPYRQAGGYGPQGF